jgi:hypothetical protein
MKEEEAVEVMTKQGKVVHALMIPSQMQLWFCVKSVHVCNEDN